MSNACLWLRGGGGNRMNEAQGRGRNEIDASKLSVKASSNVEIDTLYYNCLSWPSSSKAPIIVIKPYRESEAVEILEA